MLMSGSIYIYIFVNIEKRQNIFWDKEKLNEDKKKCSRKPSMKNKFVNDHRNRYWCFHCFCFFITLYNIDTLSQDSIYCQSIAIFRVAFLFLNILWDWFQQTFTKHYFFDKKKWTIFLLINSDFKHWFDPNINLSWNLRNSKCEFLLRELFTNIQTIFEASYAMFKKNISELYYFFLLKRIWIILYLFLLLLKCISDNLF